MIDEIRAAWLGRRAARTNFGRVTAAEFMRNLGATDAEIKQWASAVGGKINKLYEKRHGTKAPKAGLAVVKMGKKSRLVAVYAYTWDQLGLMVEATMGYAPIAKLIEGR